MLIYQLTGDTQPTNQEGITCFLSTGRAMLPNTENVKDYCFCQTGCDTSFKAFKGSNDYETDKFSLLSYNEIEHTFNFQYRVNKGAWQPLTTQGELINHSDIVNQFIVDFGLLSFGKYDFRVQQTYLGQTINKNYGTFHVQPFDVEIANDTVRIETYKNGLQEDFGDLRNYNIYSQIRLNKAILTNEQIITTVDSNPSADRELIQVHDRQFREYDLVISNIDSKTATNLVDFYFMSDVILVTDYNIQNKDYRFLSVRKKSIENGSLSYHYNQLTVKFEDYKQNSIKHSY